MRHYSTQWEQIQSAWLQKRVPQAMLFVGQLDSALLEFIAALRLLFFCKLQQQEPCYQCNDCQMIAAGEHPDTIWIKPEKVGGPIKIDQIRQLQNCAYLTPQRAAQRLILIESAERMNTSAANSLLKILEEPPANTYFILIARQLGTVLPTVLSRCQVTRFSSPHDLLGTNFLQAGECYPQGSEQALIMSQSEIVLDGLIAVLERKQHPCVTAAQWSQFDFGSLLWLLYLAYAQVQLLQISGPVAEGVALEQLNRLAFLLKPIDIFSQIDKINKIQLKINHNMNMNQTLVLEDFLLSV